LYQISISFAKIVGAETCNRHAAVARSAFDAKAIVPPARPKSRFRPTTVLPQNQSPVRAK
jgi:hypothetical protein